MSSTDVTGAGINGIICVQRVKNGEMIAMNHTNKSLQNVV